MYSIKNLPVEHSLGLGVKIRGYRIYIKQVLKKKTILALILILTIKRVTYKLQVYINHTYDQNLV